MIQLLLPGTICLSIPSRRVTRGLCIGWRAFSVQTLTLKFDLSDFIVLSSIGALRRRMQRCPMGRSSTSASKGKRSTAQVGSNHAEESGASSKALFAEARRLSHQALRKAEGPARSSVLKTCADHFRNGLSNPLSPPDREEALFDLGEVLLQMCGSLQARPGHLPGFFDGTVKKPQAGEAQVQTAIVAAGICRESAEAFDIVCSMKGQLEQEALVNNGVALNEWAELALQIPEANGGGVVAAKELLARAHQRYSAALQRAPVDVELLVNYADCCVRMAELESDDPTPTSPYNELSHREVVGGLYVQGLNAYASACANADARIGDDLAGLLHNWGSGLYSAAERSEALDEAFKSAAVGKEKFFSAMKFRPTDTSIRNGFGECLAGLVDKVNERAKGIPKLLDLLRMACDDGYGASLRIDSGNPAAHLGLGDAHLTAGKLLTDHGEPAQARNHFEESARSFQQAFDNLKKDVDKAPDFKYDELCDSMYNFACAAALSSCEEKATECLEHLVFLDALSVEDAAVDPDLATLRVYFQSKLPSGMLTS